MGAQAVPGLKAVGVYSFASLQAMAALLRRAVVRATPLMQAQVTKPAAPPAAFIRNFATTKAASPETPLMHYTSTQQATSSINHRIFYVNVIAMVFVVDAGSALLDVRASGCTGASSE